MSVDYTPVLNATNPFQPRNRTVELSGAAQLKRFAEYLVGIVLIPVALLAGVEAGLRALDLGHSRSLFIPVATETESGYARNPRFYLQFFPHEVEKSAYAGVPSRIELTTPRPADTCRIFVVGGSVAFGDVPDSAFSFPRILQVMLEETFPELSFEIQNLAVPAVNSHVMRLAVHESLFLSPDYYLIYMGNNEYIGPYGPAWLSRGIPQTADQIHTTLRLRQLLQRSRIAEWVLTASRTGSGAVHAVNPRQYFEQSRKVAHDSPARLRMYENFQANLDAIVTAARGIGAEVVLSTVGTNLRDWPPLVSFQDERLTSSERERWQELVAEAESALRSESADENRVQDALAIAREALSLDEDHAGLHYLIGRLAWELGEFASAGKAFQRARDLDGFPICATSAINARIRSVAAAHSERGAWLADAESRFQETSESGIPGNNYFYDAMHVMFPGNYIIAAEFYEHLAPRVRKQFSEAIPALADRTLEPLTQMACEQRMGLSPYLRAMHLQVVREEVGTIAALHPEFDTHTIEARVNAARQDINPHERENALRILNTAIEMRPHDSHLRDLRERLSQP